MACRAFAAIPKVPDNYLQHMNITRRLASKVYAIKRAFTEFLTLPTLIILGFLLLSLGSYALDHAEVARLVTTRNFLKAHIFANAKATSDLLGAVAAGIISVTSITITLLLLIVQQSAASMTSQVFDQFLRRKTNQLYFGFFVGLALYALITLATVNEPFNPVWGGTLAFFFTVVALYLLVLLLYTTINQMRPVEITEAIHDHILHARRQQWPTIRKTRSASLLHAPVRLRVKSDEKGYVSRINLEAIMRGLKEKEAGAGAEVEVVLLVSIGSFVAYGDTLAEVKATAATGLAGMNDCILNSIRLERQRDIDFDAAYGIEELETIAWTSISTSKSNPAPGLLTIRNLRNILARWSEEKKEQEGTLPVVYYDNTIETLMNTFQTLAVASSESMQHQNYIEIARALTLLYDRLPEKLQQKAEDVILRNLSVLGDLAPTSELEMAMNALAEKLMEHHKQSVGTALQVAMLELRQSVGKLNARGTRVPAGKG